MPYINTPGGGIGSSVWYRDTDDFSMIDPRADAWQNAAAMNGQGPAAVGGQSPLSGNPSFSMIDPRQDAWDRTAQIANTYNAQRFAPQAPMAAQRSADDAIIGNYLPVVQHQMNGFDAPTMHDRIGKVMEFINTNPQFQYLNAGQKNSLFKQVGGTDMLSFEDAQQKRAATQMQVALNLSKMSAEQREAQMKEVDFLGKMMGARPEDIHQSFNRDPAHPNQFYIPERMGMAEDGMEGKMIPGQWRGADPAHVQRMRQLFETTGWGNTPMPTPAEAAAEIARRKAATRPGVGDLQAMGGNSQPRPLWPWEQREIERVQRTMGWQDWGASPYSY